MSIQPSSFTRALTSRGVLFFAGVPDSLLKSVCFEIEQQIPSARHLVACNEGAAISAAIGFHLATNTIPVVYMQNSGLGNAINPLASLAARQICSVPMLLLIGWRAEVNERDEQLADEPQHRLQGRITLRQLDLLGIRYVVLDADSRDYDEQIARLLAHAARHNEPVAIVCRKDTFSASSSDLPKRNTTAILSREQAIEICLDTISDDVFTVTTTGMASREVFEIRERTTTGHERDFLTVGGMGHASQIALGIAIAKPGQRVACLDGDGALLMHMGGLAVCAKQNRLLHIVLNNGVHDSVGGQPTAASTLALADLAYTVGFAHSARIDSADGLRNQIEGYLTGEGSCFVEVICSPGHRKDLGRPTISPKDNKANFMKALSERGSVVHDARAPSPISA